MKVIVATIGKEQIAELIYTLQGEVLYIESAWVHPLYRGAGQMTRLMQCMVRLNAGATRLTLTCTAASRRKWQRMEFIFSGDYGQMAINDFNTKYFRKTPGVSSQAINKVVVRHRAA